jgi:thymidylate synthase
MPPQKNFFEEDTLDDLLRLVFEELLKDKDKDLIETTKGKSTEIFGAMLLLRDPRARLSRSESKGKVFSALGELFWYLSKSNDLPFIEYYLPKSKLDKESDDGKTLRNGYGERLFNKDGQNQIQNVITLLSNKPTSRKAVIQLFDASDLSEDFKSIPCTCTLQFAIRYQKLDMLVNMRSNDAYKGLPHDVFAFTMLQEIIARSLKIDVGIYKHCAGSMHLYDSDFEQAASYLKEGWQSKTHMPSMPNGDQWQVLSEVQAVEAKIRAMENVDSSSFNFDDYWADLCRLLIVYQKTKNAKQDKGKAAAEVEEIREKMSSDVYNMFIDAKLDLLRS